MGHTIDCTVPVCAAAVHQGHTHTTTRPVNLEALFGQLTGQVNAVPCQHCARGFGVWTQCVSVAGFFRGSCANCHYGSEGARCSLREYLFLVSLLFYRPLLTSTDYRAPLCCCCHPCHHFCPCCCPPFSSASTGCSCWSYS